MLMYDAKLGDTIWLIIFWESLCLAIRQELFLTI